MIDDDQGLPSVERWRSTLGAAVIASLIAGIPAGLAARYAMAVIADAGGVSMMAIVGQVTVPGTLRIVVVPMIFGIPFAWLWLTVGRRWSHRPWPVRGALYAVAMLLIPGLLMMSDSEFNVPGANRDIGRLTFIPSFLIYGALVGEIGDRLIGPRRTRG